jgi:hypothetical protein
LTLSAGQSTQGRETRCTLLNLIAPGADNDQYGGGSREPLEIAFVHEAAPDELYRGCSPGSKRFAGYVPIANVPKRFGTGMPIHRENLQHALPNTDQDVTATWDELMAG